MKIVGHGRLSNSVLFDRFSQIWRTLGLQVTFRSARGLGGPIPPFVHAFIGGCYVRFSMLNLPLINDVRSKIVGHEGGSL